MGDAQEDASGAAGVDHLAPLRDGHGERLLAQHGLVPACSGKHSRMMQRVRQGDVDRVDARVVYQCVEVAVDALHTEALGERAPLGERAAQAGGEPRARALDHGRGDEIGRDPTETHEAPAYRGWCVTHAYPSLCTRGVKGRTPRTMRPSRHPRRNMDGQHRMDWHAP